MRDWRTLLRPDLDGTEARGHGQYGQKRGGGGDSVHSVHIPDAPESQTSSASSSREESAGITASTFYPPHLFTITWQAADGRDKRGAVDFFHLDADGTVWAFVTTTDGWAAVNVTVAGVTMERTTP